jgi:hypothetical protein
MSLQSSEPSPDRDELVRIRAYAIWEEEGRPHGRDKEHWERALREMNGGEQTLEDVPPTAAEDEAAAPQVAVQSEMPAGNGRKRRERARLGSFQA